MKIYRYADASGRPSWCVETEPGLFRKLSGHPLSQPKPVLAEEIPPPTVWLAPLEPPLILGIALNYRAHAIETGKQPPERPVFFVKLPGSLHSPGQPIVLPRTQPECRQTDYEGELAVVLSRPCRNIPVGEALSCVFGYTIGNDVSARDWQFLWGGGQFNRAKSFDTFCPLGPCLVTADEIPDPAVLHLETRLNGELVQSSGLSDLVFGVAELIAFLSEQTTLPAGTVILTGTPSGVGHARQPPRYLQPGDTVSISIAGIGTLENPVIAAGPA